MKYPSKNGTHEEEKVKHMKNNTTRTLTFEEHRAIIDAFKILSDAFKHTPYSVQINPVDGNPEQVWGIAFAFDMTKEGYK